MKKIGIAILACMLTGSLCYAQQPVATPKAAPVVKVAPAAKEFSGKVEQISLADPAKGVKSEIVVTDESGKKMSFLVKTTTTIYDVNSNAVTLDKVSKDQKVKVKYDTTKEGVEEALSIHSVQ